MSIPFNQSFPTTRLRRLRQSGWIRNLTAENTLTPSDLIWSMVVHDGDEAKVPVAAMPGLNRLNVAEAAKAAKRASALGIPAIAIFPHINPAHKDEEGSESLNPDGLVPTVIKAMKDAAPSVGVICDVALDPFTSHGHDGLIDEAGYVLNDETSAVLVEQALVQADAGADVVAPSDMMDGRVGAIRSALESAGHRNTLILAYAAKYASCFYGPFRDAVGSAANLGSGDKRNYQMDPANSDEALREVGLDLAEGADLVMVKPAMPYLDVIRRVRDTYQVPTFAYQVSGEYAMIAAAGQNGWLDEKSAALEALLSIHRAGASAILTYYAIQAARWMAE